MAPCRYFQQGFCRFGNNCRFEHVQHGSQGSYGYGQQHTPAQGNKQSQYKYTNPQQTSALSAALTLNDVLNNIPRNDLIQHVSTDMVEWEKMSMWPLSCCSYWKDGYCIPGFNDLSPEELRVEAYDALKSGSISQYTTKVSAVFNEYNTLRHKFINISHADRKTFSSFLDEEKKRLQTNASKNRNSQQSPSTNPFLSPVATTKPTNPQSLFGKPAGGLFSSTPASQSTNTNNVFGSTNQSSNIFGSTQATSSVFGATQSTAGIFGSNQSTAMPPTTNQSNAGLFSSGQASGTGLFGKPAVFGSTVPVQETRNTSTPVFGAAPSFGVSPILNASPTTPNNVFGSQTTSPVTPQNANSTPVFGSNAVFGASNAPANAFGSTSNTAAAAFGSNSASSSANTNIFGSNTNTATTTSNLFGTNATNTNTAPTVLFGKPQPTSNAPTVLFGKPQPTSDTLFGKPTTTSNSLFGKPATTSNNLFGKPVTSTTNTQNTISSQSAIPAPTVENSVLIKARDTLYTVLSDLTKLELDEFNAPKFTLGKIPTRPPPQELC